MYKKISSIILISLILASTLSNIARAEFDERFYKLNDIIYYDAGEDCAPASSGNMADINLEGNDNAEKIWNFLKSKGFTDEQVAGIMGSLWGESNHFNPDLNEEGNGIGYGIAQWSFGRRTNLENYAKEQGKPISDLGVQLNFLWYELETSQSAAKNAVTSSNSVLEATTAWTLQFERPREDLRAGRIKEGEEVGNKLLSQFAGKGSSGRGKASGPITFIGDSITVGVQEKISSTFSGSNVSATVGDSIAAATSKLPNTIHDTVVINLGTNDNFDENAAEALIGKLKGKKIYWVNNFSKNQNVDYNVVNQKLSAFASRHNEVKILDWKSYVEKNGGRDKLYAADGVHHSAEGQEAYVKFLKDEIANDGNSSSNSSGSCSSSSGGKLGNATIVDRAMELARPESERAAAYAGEVTDKQMEALRATGLINYGEPYVQKGMSCDAFVSMVMSTTVDPEYAKHCCGVVNLVQYMRSNPDKYEKIPYNGSTSNMKPGDIISSGTGGGPAAHIEFYVQVNGEDKVANAGHSRTTGVIEPMNLQIMESLGEVEVWRWKG
ncbi:MAG: phage tail tip lysozyme [Candidatus Nanogingivalis sp.]